MKLAPIVLVLLAPLARAHDGPPFPVLVDRDVGSRRLSVWADPDVGEGTFYLYLPGEEAAPEPGVSIRLEAHPLDGGTESSVGSAERAPPDQPYQRLARLAFPRRGPWAVRIVIDSPAGASEVSIEVDVTPTGLGKLDLVWFSMPFVLVAFLWVQALRRRRAGDGSPAGADLFA